MIQSASPGGFRFPPGAPLTRPENPFGFSGLFPRSLRQLRNSDAVRPAHPVGADDSVRPQAAPLFTELFGEFAASQRAGRVAGPCRTPANPYCPAKFDCKADLPQQFKRNYLQIRCTVTGGAYHSARRGSPCVRNGNKTGTSLNCTRSTHQTVPQCPFSPLSFPARRKR